MKPLQFGDVLFVQNQRGKYNVVLPNVEDISLERINVLMVSFCNGRSMSENGARWQLMTSFLLLCGDYQEKSELIFQDELSK